MPLDYETTGTETNDPNVGSITAPLALEGFGIQNTYLEAGFVK
jgi:hypothetical protein